MDTVYYYHLKKMYDKKRQNQMQSQVSSQTQRPQQWTPPKITTPYDHLPPEDKAIFLSIEEKETDLKASCILHNLYANIGMTAIAIASFVTLCSNVPNKELRAIGIFSYLIWLNIYKEKQHHDKANKCFKEVAEEHPKAKPNKDDLSEIKLNQRCKFVSCFLLASALWGIYTSHHAKDISTNEAILAVGIAGILYQLASNYLKSNTYQIRKKYIPKKGIAAKYIELIRE